MQWNTEIVEGVSQGVEQRSGAEKMRGRDGDNECGTGIPHPFVCAGCSTACPKEGEEGSTMSAVDELVGDVAGRRRDFEAGQGFNAAMAMRQPGEKEEPKDPYMWSC